MRGVVLAVCLVCAVSASAAPGMAVPIEAGGLRTVAVWLHAHGTPGYVGADVADAIGIPRKGGEELVDASQRGYRDDQVLRIAQVIGPSLLLFVVQRPEEVRFYLSTTGGGLRKALMSTHGTVTPLEGGEAQDEFRREVLYWQEKARAH